MSINEIDLIANRAEIERFVDFAYRPVFPNIKFRHQAIHESSDERFISNNISFPPESIISTDFFSRGLKGDFLHFTKLSSLEKIIESQSLRLSPLSSMEDKSEFSYLSSKRAEILGVRDNKGRRKYIYSFSLMEKSNKAFKSKKMWTKYGDRNSGVALTLKIQNIKSRFVVGRVNYGHSFIQRMLNIAYLERSYLSKHGQIVTNIDSIMSIIQALCKKDAWKFEKEVRMMTISTPTKQEGVKYTEYVSGSADTRYMYIPLDAKECSTLPLIVIEEVTFGKCCKPRDLERFLRSYCEKFNAETKFYQMKSSGLRKPLVL